MSLSEGLFLLFLLSTGSVGQGYIQLGGDFHFDDTNFPDGLAQPPTSSYIGGMSSILEYCDIPGSPTLLGAWSSPFTATTLV